MTGWVLAALLPWLQALALAAVGVVAPLLYVRVLAWLRARAIDTTIYEAIGRAGGRAYSALLASGRPVTDRAAIAAAAAVGGAYLMQTVPGALGAKGVADPAAMAELAGAELGRLLAADPTVKPGG